MHTRSGRRDSTQSTARSTARVPRDGMPRWKSERCAILRPASPGGSPAIATSRVRVRSQPASNQPYASPAAGIPARRRSGPGRAAV